MKKRLLILGIIFAAAFVISCEEDDVCVGEGTPHLTVVFRNYLNSTNLKDTLTIESDTNAGFPDPDTIYLKEYADSVKLPLGGLNDDQTFFRIRRRSSSTTDVLTVGYDSKSSFESKACGYRITYDNLNYQTTSNRIEYLQSAESNVLENEANTNLYIILSN